MRLLIVEDDKSTAFLLRRLMVEDGYAVDVASTGEEARMLSGVNQYDGIVLDLQLGDRHGLLIFQNQLAARVVVTISDANGKPIRRFTAPSASGINRVAWDLR